MTLSPFLTTERGTRPVSSISDHFPAELLLNAAFMIVAPSWRVRRAVVFFLRTMRFFRHIRYFKRNSDILSQFLSADGAFRPNVKLMLRIES
jgi:hypothetical protein